MRSVRLLARSKQGSLHGRLCLRSAAKDDGGDHGGQGQAAKPLKKVSKVVAVATSAGDALGQGWDHQRRAQRAVVDSA